MENKIKTELFQAVEEQRQRLCTMSDYIFDHPESDYKEVEACGLLVEYLKELGFTLEIGVGGLPTAFRAVYECGSGRGPSIGLLCEYDAIEGIGHACGHHMQGPAIVGAAAAIQKVMKTQNYKLVVYGTPAEETTGGKLIMKDNGCFQDIDVALMFHGSPTTTTDVRCLAMANFQVTFHGTAAHAAIQPESGRSALDALLLAFQGVEFLREHVKDDTRMAYIVTCGGVQENIVPELAAGTFNLRSYNTAYLEKVIARFKKIVEGAALMTETTYEIKADRPYASKIPVLGLNELLMKNARLLEAPTIRPPREKTGSTDFGNVMYDVPGSCIRVAFVPEGTPPHSQAYIEAGKTEEAHQALILAAKVLAASVCELVSDGALFAEIREEFRVKKAEMAGEIGRMM